MFSHITIWCGSDHLIAENEIVSLKKPITADVERNWYRKIPKAHSDETISRYDAKKLYRASSYLGYIRWPFSFVKYDTTGLKELALHLSRRYVGLPSAIQSQKKEVHRAIGSSSLDVRLEVSAWKVRSRGFRDHREFLHPQGAALFIDCREAILQTNQ